MGGRFRLSEVPLKGRGVWGLGVEGTDLEFGVDGLWSRLWAVGFRFGLWVFGFGV